jgi:pimeloyl-ACP methyl ester carboxylesterase
MVVTAEWLRSTKEIHLFPAFGGLLLQKSEYCADTGTVAHEPFMSLATWMTALDGPDATREEFLSIEGSRMRCLTSGHGPAVLLLHGLLGTADAWRPTARRLASLSTVYAPDALGIGGSDRRPHLNVSLRASARRLIELMDLKQIERADIVGTSHGGSVALMLAALYPTRVRSLTLIAPANPFSAAADPLIHFYRTPLGRWFANYVPTVSGSVQSLALGRMYGDASRVRTGSLEPYITSLRIPGTVSYVLSVLERWQTDMQDLMSVLAGLRQVPALLLWGDRDRTVSLKSGERLAEYFDRANMLVIPGVGHLPHEELPAVLGGAVNGFLSGLERGDVHRTKRLRLVPRSDAAPDAA